MKKLLWNRMRQRLNMCTIGMLLALGIATWLGGATPVQAADTIPISSAEDFLNMESNPTGSYYLTKDITLPQNMKTLFSTYDLQFTGTLDGKGHNLKNYTIQSSNPEGELQLNSLFGYAKNATFNNYYKASTRCTAYSISGKDKNKTTPRATKVSSITSKNCPKLSSKYWTYSSKYKRLVLKHNKEK